MMSRFHASLIVVTAPIAGNESALRRFRTEPPPHPWLDLPFSALLDTLMIPLTLSVTAYESLE